MRYVLDSSVAFKAVIPEQDSDRAIKLLDEYRQGFHELLSPDVLPLEVGHALTKAERQGRVSRTDGFALWSALVADGPQLVPSLSLMPRAYALSSQERIGIYDCLYVALAEQEHCDLITADDRLIRVFQGNPIIPLAGWETQDSCIRGPQPAFPGRSPHTLVERQSGVRNGRSCSSRKTPRACLRH
jgi:predicted nucleic acid-binding protein